MPAQSSPQPNTNITAQGDENQCMIHAKPGIIQMPFSSMLESSEDFDESFEQKAVRKVIDAKLRAREGLINRKLLLSFNFLFCF